VAVLVAVLVKVSVERPPPGQALVQDAAERVLVGPAVGRQAPELFRGQVARGAQGGPGQGRPGAAAARGRAAEARQVQVAGAVVVTGRLDQQVGRRDVAVHQAVPMRGLQGAGRLAEQEHRGPRRQRAACPYHLSQVGSRHIAHREVQQPVAGPRLVNRDDMRVPQAGRDR
jgi:hypothetical protein